MTLLWEHINQMFTFIIIGQKLFAYWNEADVFRKVFLFSATQKVNEPCGQHIYIQEQCSTFDIDKDK